MGYSGRRGDDNCSSFTVSAAGKRTVVTVVRITTAESPAEPVKSIFGDQAAPPVLVRCPVGFEHAGMGPFQIPF